MAGYAAGDGDSAHALMRPARSSMAACWTPTPPRASRPHDGGPAGRAATCSSCARARPRARGSTGIVTDSVGATGARRARCRPAAPAAAACRGVANGDGGYAAVQPAGRHLHRHGLPRPRPALSSRRLTNVAAQRPRTSSAGHRARAAAPAAARRDDDHEHRRDRDGLRSAYWSDPLALVTRAARAGAANYRSCSRAARYADGAMTETRRVGPVSRRRSRRSSRITATD